MTPHAPSLVPTLYAILEIAARLKVSPKTVRRWVDRGELPVHRLGRQIRVSATDLAAFLDARRRP